MDVEKLSEDIRPAANTVVTLKDCGGNVGEIIFSSASNRAATILKLDKERYVNLSDGEIRTFQRGDTRQDDTISVKQSLSRLRDYLNTNVSDPKKCRWLTLTYSENMSDPEKLYADFKRFNRKCRKVFGHYEYITAAEPQARGAWHLHCVLIFDKKAPYMKNETIAEIWGNGFVNIKALKNIEDIGRYLTAYLGDMSIEEMGKLPKKIKPEMLKIITSKDNKESKAIIKGARLALYPSGFNIYRISKGIKPPTVERVANEEAEKRFADWAMVYEITYKIEDKTRDFKNIVNKRHYNRLRKNRKENKNDEPNK